MTRPLAGRIAHLATVHAAWERVRTTGTGETVVITGDDGVGKSRLAAEALTAMKPATVLAGRARAVGPAPYDWLASALDGQPLDGVPAPPEALAWLTQRPSTHRFEPGALLRLAVDVVRHRIGDGPGVLLVEDLHDLDPASLNLVADLASARALPALLLVTSRPAGGGTAARVLAQLSVATRCHLGPLTPTETAELLDGGLLGLPRPAQILRVHRRTGGNPRWITEIAAAVRALEIVTPLDSPLPPYLASLATAGLDGEDGRVARIAALLGAGLNSEALAELAGGGAETVVARLTGLGVLVPDKAGEPRFASPLVAEALAQTAPPSLRTEVHRRAYQRSLAAGDLDGQYRHGIHSGHELSPAAAVRAHLAAGRPRAALDLVELAPSVRGFALEREAAAAAHALGDYEQAAHFTHEWFMTAPADGKVEAQHHSADLCGHLGKVDEQHRLLESIAPRIATGARVAYLTSLGWAALCAERPGEAAGWAAQALELTTEPDPAALTVLGHATALNGDTERGLTLLSAARRYAAAARDLISFGRAVAASAAVRLPGLAGDAARRILDEHLTALDRHDLGGRAGPVVTAAATAAVAAGETRRARALAADRVPVETDPVERVLLTALVARLDAESGDLPTARRLRDRLGSEMFGMDSPRALRAKAALDLALAEEPEAAEKALRAYVDAAAPELHADGLADAGRASLKAGLGEARVAALLPDGGAALGIGAGAPGAELTAREREVLGCLTEGMTNQQVASRLGISIRTVTVHVSNLLRKTGSASRTEAALWAVHHGLAGER